MRVALIYNEKEIDPNDVINVFGIPTKEHYSKKAVDRVATSLEKGGHTVKVIEGDMHVSDEIREFMPKVVSGEVPGMVFNMAYGIQGQNRYTHVPAMMEMLGIPYFGSGPEAHAIVQDKVMTKIVLQRFNIPTPGFWVFRTAEDKFDDVQFPVIVKPKLESTSMGMEVVYNWDDLRPAVQRQIDKFSQDILVEQFIPGREFAIGVVGNGGNIETLPIVELDLKGDPNKIQTIDDKMKSPLEKICPAHLSKEQETELIKLCKESYIKLGLYDYARVDVRMDTNGNFFILELNSMASLGLGGSLYFAAKTAGYTYEAFINKLLDVATMRYFGEHSEQLKKIEDYDPSKPLRTVVRTYIRSRFHTIKDTLHEFVGYNTHVYNINNVNSLGKLIAKRLKHLGFVERTYNQFDIGDFRYFTNHGDEKNDILIVSHLDTHNGPRDFVPYTEDDDRIYGSGIAESKGGLAIMIGALHSLRFARRLKKVKCGILLTTDDSLGGKYSKKLVEDFSKQSKFVIGLKSASIEGGLITSCYGRTDYNVRFSSKTSGLRDLHGIIPVLGKKILALEKLTLDEKDYRVRTTSIHAEGSHGSTPDYATLSLVSSYKDSKSGNDLDTKIKKLMTKNEEGLAKLSVEIAKGQTRTPVEESESDAKFYSIVENEAKKLEIKIKRHQQFVSSDISNVPSDIPSIDGFGPMGHNYRAPNEYILHDSIMDRTALMALVIYRCSKIE
ncbi:MAG: M20/M25/M40 family metallo-hydrolase [Nitrosopumilaceae archaeon]